MSAASVSRFGPLAALLAAGAIAALAKVAWNAPTTFAGGALVALLTVAAWTDLRERKIRNLATYPAILLALLVNGVGELAPAPAWGAIGMQASALGLAACFALKFLVYCIAKGGAGDVKLAAAVGAYLGVTQGILVLCYTYILAGVAALCIVVWSYGPLEAIWALGRFLAGLLGGKAEDQQDPLQLSRRTLPLAPFFLVSTVLVLLNLDATRLIP